MRIVDTIKQSKQDVLIITTPTYKRHILQAMHDQGVIHPVAFMHKRDLFEKVFFKLKPRALHEACLYTKKRPAIAERMLGFLHKIDSKEPYETKRLETLRRLKEHLEAQGLLSTDVFGGHGFKNKRIIVYGPIYDAVFSDTIQTLEGTHPVERFMPEPPTTHDHIFTEYETVDEEIEATAKRIRDLRKQGVPYERIKIANVPSDYEVTLKNVFTRYAIPLNPSGGVPIIHYGIVKRFLEIFDASSHQTFEKALKESLQSIKPQVQGSTSARVFQKLLSALNPLVRYMNHRDEHPELIDHILSTTTITPPRYANGVDVVSIDAVPPGEDTLFALAMREGNAPQFKDEDDYLDAREKNRIAYPDATAENRLGKQRIDDAIRMHERIHFSYAKTSVGEEYSLSNHFSTHLSKTVRKTETASLIDQPYSRLSDMLKTKYQKDAHDIYGETGEYLNTLYPMFKEAFNTYSNVVSRLSSATISRLFEKKPSVSVTQIEDYFKCAFTFLLKHFLKIQPEDSPFHRHLGTFFHDALEHHLDDETLTDETLEALLEKTIKEEKGHYTAKDFFFFRETFEDLKRAHRIIRAQENKTSYTIETREKELSRTFTVNGRELLFKGKIDKILTRGDNAILIDYKTGKATLNLRHAPHGLSSQLLYYLLLYRANHPNARFSGFFEQTILPASIKREKNKRYEDVLEEYFRLRGYVINDPDEIVRIDPDYDSSPIVSGLKFNKDGSLAKNTKTIDDEILEILLERMEGLVSDAFKAMNEGKFPINPKRIKGKDVSCEYCPFEDVCYKTRQDYEDLRHFKNDDALFLALREGE